MRSGSGKVTVILRVFLGTHYRALQLNVVPAAGLLLDFAAVLYNLNLACNFVINRTDRTGEGVDVLHLDTGAQLGGAFRTDGNVYVAADGAFLHLAVADVKVRQRGLDHFKEFLRLGRGMQVGTGYHLNQRYAAAIEVNDGAVDLVMQQLARILLEVDALETAGVLHAVHIEEYLAVLADRHIKLGNLICLRRIG